MKFLNDFVVKGFCHGYVVRVGQFVKCQVSDGRARDYLAVAFNILYVNIDPTSTAGPSQRPT